MGGEGARARGESRADKHFVPEEAPWWNVISRHEHELGGAGPQCHALFHRVLASPSQYAAAVESKSSRRLRAAQLRFHSLIHSVDACPSPLLTFAKHSTGCDQLTIARRSGAVHLTTVVRLERWYCRLAISALGPPP